MKFKKWSQSEIEEEFKKLGMVLLSKYKRADDKIEYIACCGHKNISTTHRILQGHSKLCRKCRYNAPLQYEFVKKYFENAGCVLLSHENINAASKLEYIARCGHRHKIIWPEFKKGSCRICPSCQRHVKYTLDYVKNTFEKEGCKLIDNVYVNNKTNMQYIARCGHVHKIKFERFLNGEGRICPNCSSLYMSQKKVNEILLKIFGSDLQTEVCIRDSKTTRLFLDFYIPKQNLAIEYDGKQHYESGRFFNRTKDEFLKQQQRDIRKNEYCRKNNIKLLRIDGRKYNFRNLTIDDVRQMIDQIRA